MPNAMIGEIEFLVKFDTMSTSFEEAIKKALEKADISVEGDDDTTEEIEKVNQRLDSIDRHIRSVFVRTGATDDYATFLAKRGNLMRYYAKETTHEAIAGSIIKSDAMRKYLGITDEMTETEITDISMKYAKSLASGLITQIQRMGRSKTYYQRNIDKFGTAALYTEAAIEGSAVVQPFLDAWKKIIPETKVTAEMVKRFQQFGIRYLTKEGKQHELSYSPEVGGIGERFLSRLHPKAGYIGKEEGDELIDAQDLEAALLREGMSIQDIIDIYIKDKVPEGLGEAVGRILKKYKLMRDLPVPKVIEVMLEEIFEDEELFFTRKKGGVKGSERFFKKFGEDPTERLKTAADIMYLLESMEQYKNLEDVLGPEQLQRTKSFFDEFGAFLGLGEAKQLGGAKKVGLGGAFGISSMNIAGYAQMMVDIFKPLTEEDIEEDKNQEKLIRIAEQTLQRMATLLDKDTFVEKLEELGYYVEKIEDEN